MENNFPIFSDSVIFIEEGMCFMDAQRIPYGFSLPPLEMDEYSNCRDLNRFTKRPDLWINSSVNSYLCISANDSSRKSLLLL